MRTTLTLDPDVALKIRHRLAQSNQSLKKVINDALRAGLSQSELSPPPFQVIPHALSLRPGIDIDKLQQMLDEMDVEQVVARQADDRS